jgi:hypothetical protein
MKKIIHLIAALFLLGVAVETGSQETIRVGQGAISHLNIGRTNRECKRFLKPG